MEQPLSAISRLEPFLRAVISQYMCTLDNNRFIVTGNYCLRLTKALYVIY